MINLDARGLSCPEPLLMLKKAIKNNKRAILGGAVIVGAVALAITCVKNIVNKIKEKVQQK